MVENYPCKICGDEQASAKPDHGFIERIHQSCPLCGEFWWGSSTPSIPQETQVKLSAWIREQNMLNEIPEIDDTQVQRIATMPIPSPAERADLILIHAVRRQKSLDEVIKCRSKEFQAISYSQSQGELDYLVDSLVDQGFLSEDPNGYKITFQGHERYEELNAREADST